MIAHVERNGTVMKECMIPGKIAAGNLCVQIGCQVYSKRPNGTKVVPRKIVLKNALK
jgi:hypothetical protein